MPTYKRNIKTQLYSLRLFFIGTLLLCIYLFRHSLADYGYLLLMILLFISIVPVTGLFIDNSSFLVTQYYFFGLIKRTFYFQNSDNIELQPFDIELSDAGDIIGTESSWNPLFFLSSFSTTTLTRFIIKQKDKTGNVRKVKVKLTGQEYKRLTENVVS